MLDFFEYMRLKAETQENHYTFTHQGSVTEPYRLIIDNESYPNVRFRATNGHEIELDKVTFIERELNYERPYLINQDAVERLKEENLQETIKVELDSMATAVSYFYDHYKEVDVELVVYCLQNYHTATSGNSPMAVLVKFESKGSQLNSIKDHKLSGLVSHSLYTGQVSRETVEAWRYKKMDWRDVRELCPTFVEIVLKGRQP